ncbi:hypothetical protein [Bradyrhizobium sp. Tv2a-2]|uniref:hypothetical protein n=1 Tax=Bradyrhizobium sp. Tv2a-2 TaxID=113395 RepID=UPI0012EB54E5|nr:hypothetical protein [Bradyrhizobium sp. Tv2a-2]
MWRKTLVEGDLLAVELTSSLDDHVELPRALDVSDGAEHRTEVLRQEKIVEELRPGKFGPRDHHRICSDGADRRGQHMFRDRIDAVIVGSVTLILSRIDLGRDREDFVQMRAVAAHHDGGRVERLRHGAHRFRPAPKVRAGVVNSCDERSKSAFADHLQCSPLQYRLMTSRRTCPNRSLQNRS